jgi:hypothetical protein
MRTWSCGNESLTFQGAIPSSLVGNLCLARGHGQAGLPKFCVGQVSSVHLLILASSSAAEHVRHVFEESQGSPRCLFLEGGRFVCM